MKTIQIRLRIIQNSSYELKIQNTALRTSLSQSNFDRLWDTWLRFGENILDQLSTGFHDQLQ